NGQALVAPPRVAQRMRNQRIRKRSAHEILLAEWNIQSARTNAEQSGPASPRQDVLEINVQLAQLESLLIGLTRQQLELGVEINVPHHRRLDRDDGIIRPELSFRKLAVPPGVEEGEPGFGGDPDCVFPNG